MSNDILGRLSSCPPLEPNTLLRSSYQRPPHLRQPSCINIVLITPLSSGSMITISEDHNQIVQAPEHLDLGGDGSIGEHNGVAEQ